MGRDTPDELQEALRPIASLISKSEKAQQRLAPGTWQHTMLRDNLGALHIVSALMNPVAAPKPYTQDDLRGAFRALEAMIRKTDQTQTKFLPGTSQHTLQRNRLNALRIAASLVEAELNKSGSQR